MGKKRIILDCEQLKHKNTGLFYYTFNLGKELQSLLDGSAGESIEFYGNEQDLQVMRAHHILPEHTWETDKVKMLIEPGAAMRFYKKLRGYREVWHAPFQSGRILPKQTDRLKILLTIHDLNELHEPAIPYAQKQEAILRTQEKIDQSNAIVCISDFCRSDVLKHVDIKGKPLHVIHNGTNELAAPSMKPVYQPKGPFLFSIGYVNKKKNFHVLVPLLETMPGLELVIAGKIDDETYLQEMQRSAQRLGVIDRLHILGPVSEGDKAWYLSNCLAFMFPSIAEGFGLPVTEAMHFGKPIFLSTLTSLPEIGADVAFYFPTFQPEGMKKLFLDGMETYRNGDLKKRIEQRGRDFNWKKTATEYLQVYRQLLES